MKNLSVSTLSLSFSFSFSFPLSSSFSLDVFCIKPDRISESLFFQTRQNRIKIIQNPSFFRHQSIFHCKMLNNIEFDSIKAMRIISSDERPTHERRSKHKYKRTHAHTCTQAHMCAHLTREKFVARLRCDFCQFNVKQKTLVPLVCNIAFSYIVYVLELES